uniref:Protein arginine N-methyltransferase n=1 Tax=Ciona savignyi TaxID=51511 RepID=H2ZKD3_CIOSA
MKQTLNSVTGKSEWEPENLEEHDYFTDIARSSYADMLHDTERNKLYYEAIKLAVEETHRQGKVAKVLDIGTGSGLLSMMAATAGAEVITAIEVNIVKRKGNKRIVLVTKKNGFGQIKVINKHSTEVELGKDLAEKANILITELFDTELIGEGALSAYHHAHQNLMEENCIAVPHKATTFIQLVESETMLKWNQLLPIKIGKNVEIQPNKELVDGHGVPSVHDIQLSQFPVDKFKAVSDPTAVFQFEWGSKELTDDLRSNMVEMKAISSGTAQVVLSWWDLQMDQEGGVILSTAPKWCHPTPHNMQWRDHWIQSVYFLPTQISYNKDDIIRLKAFHDDYSLWFDNGEPDPTDERPQCDYPPRMIWSRPRLGMLNDNYRNSIFVKAIESLNIEEGRAICLSDFSLLPLVVAQCHPRLGVVALEKSTIAQRGLVELKRSNNIDNLEVVRYDPEDISKSLESGDISLFVAEPFFATSYLPWHDLYFWYARSQLELGDHCKVMPCKAHLCLAAVEFKDLLIEEALEKKEIREAEAHALWEYPCTLVTPPCRVMCFDFTSCVPEKPIISNGSVDIAPTKHNAEMCHGVVLWMEYQLTPNPNHCISTGLQPASINGDFTPHTTSPPIWTMHHRQAVFFHKQPFELSNVKTMDYNLTFLPQSGEINMKY